MNGSCSCNAANYQNRILLSSGKSVKLWGMGTLILLLTMSSLLAWWHVELNALAAISLRLVRRYLSWSVAWKATRLVRLAKAYVGFRLEVDDDAVKGLVPPFLIVANHQSLADIALVLSAFSYLPIRFVAKSELRSGFPAVSAVLRFQQHALIDRRGNFREAIATLRRLARRSRAGLCPVIFPEGTRSRTGGVGKFYAGAVKTIHSAVPMPIVCLALDGGRRFVTYNDIRHGVAGAVYRMKVVDVRRPETSELARTLDDFRDLIENQLDEWQSGDNDHCGKRRSDTEAN